jgi:hypothetical protein
MDTLSSLRIFPGHSYVVEISVPPVFGSSSHASRYCGKNTPPTTLLAEEIFSCKLTLTVIRFLRVSAKFGTCTVVSINGTLIEAKMCTFTLESTHFIFNKCPIYTYDGASAKFSTNSQETDYSAVLVFSSVKTAGPDPDPPGTSLNRLPLS